MWVVGLASVCHKGQASTQSSSCTNFQAGSCLL